jgi:protein-S-isoprenylcysteine O-methyltransferase Ste14
VPTATLAGLGRRLRRLETRISSFDTTALSAERHLMGAVAVLAFWLLFVTCSVLDTSAGRNAAEVATTTGLITVLTFSALTYLVIRTLGSDEQEVDEDDDLLIAV